MRSLSFVTATLLLLPFAPELRADVLVGNPPDSGTGFCYPFACFYSGDEFQQVYTSSLFPGPFEITGLEFFEANLPTTGRAAGSVVISLSTTAADWNTLSHSLSANIGPNQTQVFAGSYGPPWSFPTVLVFPFSTPFLYDPSQGNLLVDIRAFVTVGGVVDFASTGVLQPNNFTSVAFNLDLDLPSVNPDYGLVFTGQGLETDFIGAPVSEGSSVPEPSSILLLSSALGGLGYFGYARRRSP